jgi:hypothetical protein
MRDCQNIGVCHYCKREVGDNHLCEQMCNAAPLVIRLAQERSAALARLR